MENTEEERKVRQSLSDSELPSTYVKELLQLNKPYLSETDSDEDRNRTPSGTVLSKTVANIRTIFSPKSDKAPSVSISGKLG